MGKPKVFLLEDHDFFGTEIREFFEEDKNFQVTYAKNYEQAISSIKKSGPFDFSILDVVLQNGKTGFDVIRSQEANLGKIMIVTGCTDEATLSQIRNIKDKVASASKWEEIWPKIHQFLEGALPTI